MNESIDRNKVPAVPDELFIGGTWSAGDGKRKLQSIDPFTGEVWTTLPYASHADVDAAVEAAANALTGEWRRWSGRDRRRLLLRIAERLHDNREWLAQIETRDNGKPIREMRGQLDGLPDWYEFYAGTADKLRGSTVPLSKQDFLGYTLRPPVGVVAAITAWNSPLLLLAWKLAPALAAGCTMVVKPSEHASASTLAFCEVLEQAGVPAGVVNVVTGGPDVGSALVNHPRVDKVTFTGSVEIGSEVGSAASRGIKRVTLELGGKSPNIVFNDAPFEAAVSGAVSGIFAASGQTCAAGSRLFVQSGIYDEFVKELRERADGIKLGDPLDHRTEMGPVAFEGQLSKVQRMLSSAVDDGAEVLAGGHRPDTPGLADGFFIEPTVLGSVTNEMSIAQEEVFGPLLAVMPFDTDENVLQLANASDFGLAAGVWTQDVSRAHRMAADLQAGTVWVNAYRTVSYEMPYGGLRASGVGRENGIEAVEEFLEHKAVWINTGSDVRDPFKLG